jgi:5'-nucleotidase
VRREDPRGRPYYWIGGEPPLGIPEQGTDVGALAAGRISVTPLLLDLTHYGQLESLKALLGA